MLDEGISRRDFSLAALFVAAGLVIPKPVQDSLNRLGEEVSHDRWRSGSVDDFAKFIAPYVKVKNYDTPDTMRKGFHYMVQVYSRNGGQLKGLYGAEATVQVRRRDLEDGRVDLVALANDQALRNLAEIVLRNNQDRTFSVVEGKLVSA